LTIAELLDVGFKSNRTGPVPDCFSPRRWSNEQIRFTVGCLDIRLGVMMSRSLPSRGRGPGSRQGLARTQDASLPSTDRDLEMPRPITA
jgi:hypothetical protein